jgi:Flp pilus assembly pilin Flp
MRERAWLIERRLAELFAGRGRRNESGQDLVEYALIVGFIAVACAALIPYTASSSMREIYNRIAEILLNSTNQT